ncbi:MAG: AAA family ATPase [Deltaproteobacteria bacterium]|nr:AAA family ATPase [Deltaproteobacteria bacterium]
MQSTCHVCEKLFKVRFRYQVREEAGEYIYVCSTGCQQSLVLGVDGVSACDTCGRTFQVEYPYQVSVSDGRREYFCSTDCRERGHRRQSEFGLVRPTPKRIAVFNHKGGTGKTTTAINLAAGMAEAGRRVLLIDADGQGNVGASLGIAGQRTLYHVLVNGAKVSDVAVPVRDGLDVLTSNESLAAAELFLAERPNRDRIMRERLGDACRAYDTVVIDCAPALSLMNQNAMVYADSVIVPVACDYLSLVGVKQVLRTIHNVRELLQHDVQLLGVLPTFFDVRNRISREAIVTLRKHFEERCYDPIRINTKLREAPSAKQTIFEYAPKSHGAEDYMRLVQKVTAVAMRGQIARPEMAVPAA